MEHLATEAVVAFVDGELSMTAYQRAAAHLSVCTECAADVEAQQYARRAVRSASPMALPADLWNMLCRIPETSVAPPCEPGSRFVQQAPLPDPAPVSGTAQPGTRPLGSVRGGPVQTGISP